MSSDKKTTYEINADGSGFIAEMAKVGRAAVHTSGEISEKFEALTSVVGKVGIAFAAFAAIVEGGEAFKHAVGATQQWALAQDELARKLGVSASQAGAYQIATEKLGIDSNVLITASDKLAKQMQVNTGAFAAMGIETKNANGGWKTSGELLPEVIEKLRAIDNPMQQTIAGQKLFGKGWSEIYPLLRMTSESLEEAKGEVQGLGLVMDPKEARAYQSAMAGVEAVGHGLENVVARALMPALTEIGEYFASVGPQAVNIFRTALDVIINSVKTVAIAFKELWIIISGVFKAFKEFGTYGAGHGLEGAKRALREMQDELDKTDAKFVQMWKDTGKPPAIVDEKPAQSPNGALDLDNAAKENHIAILEEELAAQKVKYATEHDLREMSKAEEVDYWLTKRQQGNLTAQELVTLDRKVADLRLQGLREQRAIEKGLNEEQISEAEKAGLGQINAAAATARSEQALGNITKEQLLAQEVAFEDQRLAITTKALQDRAALLKDDPDRNAVALAKIQDDILDQTRAHDLKIQEINAAAAKDSETSWKKVADQITSSFAGVAKGLVSGTMTIYGAFSKLFQGVIDAAINMAAKMIEQWAVAAVESHVIGGTSRAAEVTGNAATGASAAYASTAAIPVVGPAMAPAAAASAYGSIMAFLPQASAFGGFDIPSGMNPVTQLHAEEMVLPAKLANPLRDSLSGGGMGGGDVHLHVHAIDGADAKRFLMGNQAHLASAIKAAHRNARFS
jgi:hypothetical protein